LSQSLAPIKDALRALSRLGPQAQYDALIESERTTALVRALAPQDLHAIAQAVGKEEALELLPHCDGNQLVGLTDLSGWQGFAFDLVGFEDWLTAMFESGHQTVKNYLKSADIEQVLLYLNNRVRVHECDEEGDFPTLSNEVPGDATWTSPDRKFLLEISDWLKDHDRLPGDPIKALLKLLEGMDPFKLSRVLAALQWELKTPLEEDCLRLRNARMEELGFPPLEEAVALFARGRPDHILARGKRPLKTEPSDTSEALVLRIQPRHDLLASALTELAPAAREHALQELAYVANQTMVANGIAVGDPVAVKQQWHTLRACISLGLEYAARLAAGASGDPLAQATQCLRTIHSKALFRAGFNVLLPLQDLARNIARDARSGPQSSVVWLTANVQTLIEGLLEARPLHRQAEQKDQPIERLSDVRSLAEKLGAQLDIMDGVFTENLCAKAVLDINCTDTNMNHHGDLDLVILQRTSEAHEVLSGTPRLSPLPHEALEILHNRLNEEHPVARILEDARRGVTLTGLWVHVGG
jgi:hypothetical protein